MSSLATPSSTIPLSQVTVIPSRSSLSRSNSYDRDRQLLRRKRQWQRRRDSSASTTGSSRNYDNAVDDNVHMIQTEEPIDLATLTGDVSILPLRGNQFEFQFQLDTK